MLIRAAQGAGWCNMDGISLCTKNEIYIHHFLKIISKAVGISSIVHEDQADQGSHANTANHMVVQSQIWLLSASLYTAITPEVVLM